VSEQFQHAMLPRANRDEAARQDFVMALRKHMQGSLTPGNQAVYQVRIEAAYIADHGRAPTTRHEVATVMKRDPYYQFWSALQRVSQQAIWDSVTDSIVRDHASLKAKAKSIAAENPAGGALRLNPNLPIPHYVTAADIHLMPGGYVGDDATEMRQGPLYDRGLYLYIGGQCGPENDGLVHMLRAALAEQKPDFTPKRILDLGCTIGNSTVPWKNLFPDAEVFGIDVSQAALCYAHARAEALGVPVTFVQANAEFTEFESGSFDLVTSCLLLHETSVAALPRILAECRRLVAPGGVMAHLDVPQVLGLHPLQAFLTSWEEENNNENFAHLIREMDLPAVAQEAGWDADEISQPNISMAGTIDVKNYDSSRQLAWTFLLGQR
jgi:ubiquinone/menaquinone biosynthesis C-methylase UbiE